MYDNNSECPICFEKINNPILLSCGHSYDYFCIQNHCYNFILNNKKPFCPYCRKNITNKDILDICKNWSFINYKPNDWKNHNTFDLTKKKIKIKAINKVEFDYNLYDGNLFIPLNKNYYPFFLISPIIKNINLFFDDNIIMLSKNFDINYTNYNESISSYIYGVEGNLIDLQWYNFLKTNYNIITKNIKLSEDIINTIIISDNYIKCYISNPDNIIIIDLNLGSMTRGLIINNNKKCKFLFKIFFYEDYHTSYIINELYGIMYL